MGMEADRKEGRKGKGGRTKEGAKETLSLSLSLLAAELLIVGMVALIPVRGASEAAKYCLQLVGCASIGMVFSWDMFRDYN